MIYNKPKNKTIYKQYDPRWAYLPYPTKNYSFGGSGCGCVSVTHCAMEFMPNLTPIETRPYMVQFATKGNGTLWDGITKGLIHFGLKNVLTHPNPKSLWEELKRGNRVGVLLFNNNPAPDGRRFTSGGHYIAFTGFKTDRKGRHWLYLKDSGGRNNSGWICYETSMAGCIRHIWSASLPKKVYYKIALPKRGFYQLNDKSPEIKKIQRFLKDKGYYRGKVGGRYGILTKRAVERWQKDNGLQPDGLWGEKTNKKYEDVK